MRFDPLGTDGRDEVVLDITHRHPTRVEGDDHVIEATQPSAALGHERRGERAVAVPRDRELDIADTTVSSVGAQGIYRVRLKNGKRLSLDYVRLNLGEFDRILRSRAARPRR